MKKSFLALGALTLLLMASCKEDFDVAAPYKQITVAYGMLNVTDTAHYVRIQKAFLDETKSAIQMAQNPDSIYFPDGVLIVKLREFSTAGSLMTEEVMQRVDLNLEGYPKEGGSFASSPNIGYKSKKVLNPNYLYRIVMTNTQTGEVDSAETYVINNSNLYINQTAFNPLYKLNFSRPQPKSVLNLTVHVPQNPTGYTGKALATYFEGALQIRYATKQGGDTTRDSITYYFPGTRPGTEANGVFNMSVEHNDLLNFMAAAIPPATSGQERLLDSANLIVWAAGPDYANYLQFAATQGGITADQIRPVYTNIRGTDVYGLLSTRTRYLQRNVQFDAPTLDTIMHTAILQPLRFTGRTK